MARLSKIPPELNDEVIKKSGEGYSASKIQTWLDEEHSITITDRGIQQFLKKIANERKDIAKQAYSKAVADSANQDVAIIGEMIDLFRNEVLKTVNNDSLKAAKIAETLIKFQDRRMKLSGIDKEDEVNDDSVLDSLLAKVGK